MKLPPLLGSAALASSAILLSGCASQAAYEHDHWTGYSIAPRVSRAFLSYDPEKYPVYRDFQWQKKKNIELTLRRHFFNHNPDNPFEADDKTVYAPRGTHSLVPNPVPYIHLEGLVLGAAAYAGGGIFVPIPVDSLIGTFEDGGSEEFIEGVDQFTKPLGVITASCLHDAMGFPETKGDAWRH
jgi:hypothetical protein